MPDKLTPAYTHTGPLQRKNGAHSLLEVRPAEGKNSNHHGIHDGV